MLHNSEEELMMKRLLIALLASFVIAGCSNAQSSDQTKETKTNEETALKKVYCCPRLDA